MSRNKDAIMTMMQQQQYINERNAQGRSPLSVAASMNMASVV